MGAAPAHAATITLSPATAAARSQIAVQGEGLPRRALVSLRAGRVHLRTVRVDGRGRFAVSLTLPRSLHAGRWNVVGRVSRQQIGNPLRIVPRATPTAASVTTASAGERVFVSPTTVRVGAKVTVRGTRFARGKRAEIVFAGTQRRSLRPTATSFSSSFTAPAARVGRRVVVVRSQNTLMRIPLRIVRGPEGPAAKTPTGAAGTSPLAPRTPPVTHGSTGPGRVLVDTPFALDFTGDRGGLADANGIGTGFTYTPPTHGAGYIPRNLTVDAAAGLLRVETTSGIAFRNHNSLDNALAVGVAAWAQPLVVETTVVQPHAGTNNYEQAGLWFGTGQDAYVKLVVISMRGRGMSIQALLEAGGKSVRAVTLGPLELSSAHVSLRLVTRPVDRRIVAFYGVNAPPDRFLARFAVPPEFFTIDRTAVDPAIGTNSFAGIFATNRLGPGPLAYAFDNFSVVGATG